MHQTGKTYVHEIDGLGRRMPVVFTIFTISGLALMGVPGLAGFISKWNLANAAVANEHPLALVGVMALLISALLTAVYMMSICVRALFPGRKFDYETIETVRDPCWMMRVPMLIFVVVLFIFGLHSGPLVDVFEEIVAVL